MNNMKNTSNVLIVVLSVLALMVLGLLGYLFLKRSTQEKIVEQNTSDLVEFPENPQKGDPGYQEKDTAFKVEKGKNASAVFERIEGNQMYISVNGTETSYLLNADEIALQCTSQKLDNVTEINLDLVTDVKLELPSTLGSYLSGKMPIFVIVGDAAGFAEVHTIAVPESVCNI